MKKDIHPKYYENVNIKCACGNSIIAGSTKPALDIEVCSACHPLYTGKVKNLDTAGRIDKFKIRAAAKQEKASKSPRKTAGKK